MNVEILSGLSIDQKLVRMSEVIVDVGIIDD